MNKTKLQEQIDKFVTPKPPEPKHDMTDCTGRPDLQEIMAACMPADNLETRDERDIKAMRGGWYEGRFFVYARDLKQWRGAKVETIA